MIESKLLFIVGFPRSGTSVLTKILGSNQNVSIQNESKFIVEKYESFSNIKSDEEIRQFAKELSSHLTSKESLNIRMEESKLYEILNIATTSKSISKKEAWRIVCLKILMSSGKFSLIGEKTPNYVFHLDFLVSVFPEAKFLYVHRDPRDSFLSIKSLFWGPSNALFVAREVNKYVKAWENFSQEKRKVNIIYEDFLKSPQQIVAEILGNFDIEGDCDVSNIRKGNYLKWKNKFNISRKELGMLNYYCYNYMRDKGYELGEIRKPSFMLITVMILDQAWSFFYNRYIRD